MLESEYIYDYLETICLYIDNGWNLFRARGKSGDQAFPKLCLDRPKTLSTLRSLRIGDGVVTGNQTIEPVDGYYVTTDRGAIVIHTPEPMDVVIIGMNGKVAYRGEVTDGRRIMVSSGIYAVNGQLVRVK